MQSLADDVKKTPAQLFFRFLIQSSITPLTGTCSTSHMKQDLDTLNFQLSNETMKTISHLLA
jgi:diketogulonate reductase-like aldo/keto reductase